MSEIIDSVSTRIEVKNIGEALPTYQCLAGDSPVRELSFPEFRLAVVGPFMLFEGDPEVLAAHRRNATLRVHDLDAAIAAFTSRGGELVSPVAPAAGGRRVHLKDRDGNLFECFEPGAA
ncbi:VOC family protein [Amycolatopsis sp. CA-161197]|uniref:VOC family protein n=1 Tax=unclassified Amycolatopsis TaxID=2618356 RepID=UPI003454021E